MFQTWKILSMELLIKQAHKIKHITFLNNNCIFNDYESINSI